MDEVSRAERAWWGNWLGGSQRIGYPYWMVLNELRLKCGKIHYPFLVHWKDIRKKGKDKKKKTRQQISPNLSDDVLEFDCRFERILEKPSCLLWRGDFISCGLPCLFTISVVKHFSLYLNSTYTSMYGIYFWVGNFGQSILGLHGE